MNFRDEINMDKLDNTEYSRSEAIELLKEGICPYCKKSGLRNVLNHIRISHGVQGNELKDMLLVSRDESFIPNDLSNLHRNNAIKNNTKKFLNKGRKGHKHSYITKAKILNNRTRCKISEETRKKMQEKTKLKTEDYITVVVMLTNLLNEGIKISEAYGIIADKKGLSSSQVRTQVRDSVKKGIAYIDDNSGIKGRYYHIKLKQEFL